jgi:hypothetical protein
MSIVQTRREGGVNICILMRKPLPPGGGVWGEVDEKKGVYFG